MRMVREISSPCNGYIKNILVNRDDFVYEWQVLMMVQNETGESIPIHLSSSGYIDSLKVNIDKYIEKDTLIGHLVEDTLPCGSD
ncbi:hypothetical protein PQ478_10565 [Alkalihalophilus pseudofirmus]|uniref:hypothetical protein n=1 Tax=Alkalihalophilus pseudofirmus TaxID=79885 RepID=UPI00259B35AF|nr:hypothetical protein [Alkalihalophilus pseudofirmus]WEG18903.1 hypothetical protein PQ478_10565 [Alkalihalophilus pseudofirmus]